MNYSKIRKQNYKVQRERHWDMNIDIEDWLRSPYTAFKAKFHIEFSCLIVYFLQYTPIKPNWISLLFTASGIVGAIFLGSGNNNLIIAGLIIFFSKVILDSCDGLLARTKKETSVLGNLLDDWAGLVNSLSFLVGLGLYLYQATQEIHFMYFIILIITLRHLDLKDYAYHQLMYTFYKDNKLFKKLKNKNKKIKIIKKSGKVPSILILLKNFFQNFLDDRARTVDSIALIILIELTYDKIILTNFIYYFIIFKLIVIFLGGFYLVYFKKFLEKLIFKIS